MRGGVGALCSLVGRTRVSRDHIVYMNVHRGGYRRVVARRRAPKRVDRRATWPPGGTRSSRVSPSSLHLGRARLDYKCFAVKDGGFAREPLDCRESGCGVSRRRRRAEECDLGQHAAANTSLNNLLHENESASAGRRTLKDKLLSTVTRLEPSRAFRVGRAE